MANAAKLNSDKPCKIYLCVDCPACLRKEALAGYIRCHHAVCQSCLKNAEVDVNRRDRCMKCHKEATQGPSDKQASRPPVVSLIESRQEDGWTKVSTKEQGDVLNDQSPNKEVVGEDKTLAPTSNNNIMYGRPTRPCLNCKAREAQVVYILCGHQFCNSCQRGLSDVWDDREMECYECGLRQPSLFDKQWEKMGPQIWVNPRHERQPSEEALGDLNLNEEDRDMTQEPGTSSKR